MRGQILRARAVANTLECLGASHPPSSMGDYLRDTSKALSRLCGVISGAGAESRSKVDVTMLHNRLTAFRHGGSGLPSQEADELLHLAIIDAAGNATLRDVIMELESRISIAAPAHL